MSYGIKMTREPQPDMSAPDVPDYAEADAIRAMCFVADVRDGRDSAFSYVGHQSKYPISWFLSDRGQEARDFLFAACHQALHGNKDAATARLLRYIELCANEFAQETE